MVRDCRAVSGCVLRRRLFSWPPLFSAEQKLDHHMRCSAAAIMARVIAIATRYFTITLGKQDRLVWLLDLSACLIMRSSLGDRIKCCTLSVCPVLSIHSKSESHRIFKFGGGITLDPSNWERKFEVSSSKDKVTGNENVNIVFRASSWKNGPIYVKPARKWSSADFTSSITFHRRKCVILWHLSVFLSYLTYLSFTHYWNAVESSYFMRKLVLTLVTGEVILRSKSQRLRSLPALGTKM